jgi:hypothetical protein
MFLAVPTINTPGVSRATGGSFAYLLGFPQNLRQQEQGTPPLSWWHQSPLLELADGPKPQLPG